jgi:acyl-coenzyme A synthetase/AMP-(fatty) acid ligase
MRVLHAHGVRRGQSVAVGAASFSASMILLIAAESLGAVSVFFLEKGDPDVEALFGLVDWVISDLPQAVPPNARFIPIDKEFVARLQATPLGDRADLPLVVPELHEPQRISRTSGSSGPTKFMVLSRQAQEYWISSAIITFDMRSASTVLILGPLVMNGMYSRACACLRLGAVAMALTNAQLPGRELTHIASMPVHLTQLLDSLPHGYVHPRRVDVIVVGGFFTPALRARVGCVFAGRIMNRYGTNETGAISDDIDAAGIGIVSVGVDIRIVDEAGADVAPGALGAIAVRTPSMVEEYVGEPQATAASFRDGWFYSGDWGALVSPRVLRLAGRHDDVVNVSGLKYPAKDIEARIRELVHPLDCAVLATNLQGGRATLGVALVVAPEAPRDELARAVDRFLEHSACVIFVDAIPMMTSGKVDRLALHGMFAAQAAERPA